MNVRLILISFAAVLVLTGCGSSNYQVSLKRPNPLLQDSVTVKKKPKLVTHTHYQIDDEHGGRFQIEAQYVQKILPPAPPAYENAPKSYYTILLKPDNLYGVEKAESLSKPVLVKKSYYQLERMDGEVQEISKTYVTAISPKSKDKNLDAPQTFRFR